MQFVLDHTQASAGKDPMGRAARGQEADRYISSRGKRALGRTSEVRRDGGEERGMRKSDGGRKGRKRIIEVRWHDNW